MKKKILIILIGLIVLTPTLAIGAYSRSSATNYLTLHSENPWSTMGLIALGATAPSDYLKSITGESAIEYAAPILAITATGGDPRNFGATDYVAKLKTYYSGGQIGNDKTINDDIFGLLALLSSGEPIQSEIISSTKSYITSKQNSDGGWGFIEGAGSDTNITSAAIAALIASGISASSTAIARALGYLKDAQNADGGFPYDPLSPFGNASDSSSTSWVIWALNSSAINPSSWAKGNNTPTTYLESTQHSSGYFEYQKGSGENAFSATNTGYSAIALTGKTLPLRVISNNSSNSGNNTFSFKIQGKNSIICQGSVAGPTALNIVRNATSICSFTYEIRNTAFGQYLYRINDETAQGADGWLYSVNSITPGIGASPAA